MISTLAPDYTKTPVSLAHNNFIYSIDPEKIKPEISIITAFHNTGKLFEQTVHCILNQSFQNFEWIIVDDTTKDPLSLKLLTELEEKDTRIKIIRNKENLGPGGSRNEGIKISKGNYLFFVDSDDLTEFTIIEKYWIFLKTNPEFSFCSAWHVGFGAETYLWQLGFERGKLMFEGNSIQPTFMARRQVFDLVTFDENIRHGFEDWDFWMKCASKGMWGYTIREFLFWYRRCENPQVKWKDWDLSERMEKFKKEIHSKYYKVLQHRFPEPKLATFQRGTDLGKPIFENKEVNPLSKTGKKRLLFIIPWMVMGGADKFNLDLVKGLTSQNWEVTLVTTQTSGNEWYSEFSKYTSDVFILHNYASPSLYTHILDHLISSRYPDCILLSNSEMGLHLIPYIKFNFPDIPLIDYNHMEEDYWNQGGHPKQSVIYQSLIDKNIVSSKHLKQWMVMNGADGGKIDVVYTSSDYKNLQKDNAIRDRVRKNLGLKEDICAIVFSGRLTHQKQPFLLLNTINELEKTRTGDYVLVIAGDGPEFESMRKWVLSYKLESRIIFLGSISHKENLELMQAGDIFFLPSLWEGISLAIYEAMTLELPVVGADVGGQKELVTPDCGYLVPRSNPENEMLQYALILNSLIENAEKRKLLGIKSRGVIKNGFGLESMIASMDEILTNCIGKASAIQIASFNQLLRQHYASFFFEKNLSDELWQSYSRMESEMHYFKNLSDLYLQQQEQQQQHLQHLQQLLQLKQSSIAAETVVRDWYYDNYEILPMWYKRLGQIFKILSGKRDWRSVYSSKFKPDPNTLSHKEWYAREYELLPTWYKNFGQHLKARLENKRAHLKE